jgi:hypothetical protein
MSSYKKVTWKGTLWQVFYLPIDPLPSYDPILPPLHTDYVYILHIYLFTQGRGGGMGRANQREC